MTIGKKIKQLRKNLGLSQKKLAKNLGISCNTISFWEQDMFEPSIFNCIALANYFKISLDELCGVGEYRK